MRTPPLDVVAAFGARADGLTQLPGGQGVAWTDGRVVLKPYGFPPEVEWVCDVYATWSHHDVVRVPEPIATPAGSWVHRGWAAHVFVAGDDADPIGDLAAIKEASDAFHASLIGVPRPAFADYRFDPWAYGDRLAFEDADPQGDERTLALIAVLQSGLAPLTAPDQPVHGDILPNVLLRGGHPPAVIDWPPYFRPRGFGNAIAVTDAVVFRGAPISLFDHWAEGDDWDQLLVRAMLYRLGPTGYFVLRNHLEGSLITHVERAEPIADVVLARL